MTPEEAIKIIKNEIKCVETDCIRSECRDCPLVMSEQDILTALNMAIEALGKPYYRGKPILFEVD